MSNYRHLKLDTDPILQPTAFVDNEDAEFSIVSVLHGRLAEVYEALPDELRRISEFELCDKVQPNPSDYRMRQNFHDAVKVARAKGEKIRVTSIYEDVVARQTFFDFYMKSDLKVAFFTRPVVAHHQYFDAILKEGLRKMYLFVARYDLDPKHMPQFMKLITMASDRTIGPVAQRIQMHSKQEITQTNGERSIDVTPESPAELEAKIKELQARQSAIKPAQIDQSATNIEDES